MTVAVKCTDTCRCLKAWCWGAYTAYGSAGTLIDWPDWLLHLQFCGALFNLAKALGMQGKGAEAAEAYEQAAEVTLSSLLPLMRTHVQHVSEHRSFLYAVCNKRSVQGSKHRSIHICFCTPSWQGVKRACVACQMLSVQHFCTEAHLEGTNQSSTTSFITHRHRSVVQASRGLHGSTYTKALASLKTFPPERLAEMQQAAAYLARAQGLLLCIRVTAML